MNQDVLNDIYRAWKAQEDDDISSFYPEWRIIVRAYLNGQEPSWSQEEKQNFFSYSAMKSAARER